MNIIPQYWKNSIKENKIQGKEIDIPDNVDLTEIGATFEIMSEENAIEEMKEF